MAHIFTLKWIFAASFMLNLFYLILIIPAKNERIRQLDTLFHIWKERYFSLLKYYDDENNPQKETWNERVERYKRENPEDGGGEGITG